MLARKKCIYDKRKRGQDYKKTAKKINPAKEEIKHKDIDTILDTADLTPTIANLFGLSYNPSNYLGTDVFSSYHDKYVYFSNYSWYDGKIYYKGEKIDDIDLDYVKKISEEVNEKISINDKILNSDYFATLKNK